MFEVLSSSIFGSVVELDTMSQGVRPSLAPLHIREMALRPLDLSVGIESFGGPWTQFELGSLWKSAVYDEEIAGLDL